MSPQPRPAWTSGWAWAGAGVFFGGLLIAGRALGGWGRPAECGTFSLDCVVDAAFWLFATQGLAAVLLWIAVARLPARSQPRGVCAAVALLASLVFLAGSGFVASVIFRTV